MPRRRSATAEEWQALRAAKADRCRLCGTTKRVTLHHLVPRSLGGDDVEDNLVPLCGSGTTGCHGAVEAWAGGIRRTLRSRLRVEEIAYMTQAKGAYFVDRYYPPKED